MNTAVYCATAKLFECLAPLIKIHFVFRKGGQEHKDNKAPILPAESKADFQLIFI